MPDTNQSALTEMTTELVSAYVAKNSVPAADLPALIVSIHAALDGLGRPAPVEIAPEPLKPAVPVKRSVTDDYIISLEDGRKLKSMKRYLAGLGMTPAQYREKWNLPHDYPMVAPSYAAKRSELARSLGLGRKVAQLSGEVVPEIDEPEVEPAARTSKSSRKNKKAA